MEKHKHTDQKNNTENKQEQHEQIVEKKDEEKNIENILSEKDKKINELTDKYLRALAELDNYRKRVVKERQEFEKNTKCEAINIFLPVLDNLERANSAIDISKDIESLKKGIGMIIKQFNDILKDLGVKEVETQGIFNPEIHQVLHKEYVEGKSEGEILEVYQKGYYYENKIIRPALVKVAYIPDDKRKQINQEENKEVK